MGKKKSLNDQTRESDGLKIDTISDHKDDEKKKVPVFSTNEAIDAINIMDTTIEVVGFIDSCEREKTVGTTKKYKIMKFVMNNGAGRRIQCVAWEDNVAKVENIIAINKIIHLDRVSAKRVEQRYNSGNVSFELSVRQSTEVFEKGWYDAHEGDGVEADEVSWDKIADMEGKKIKINGWIKSTFQQTRHKSGQASFGLGSITDGKEKLEIRITVWSDMENPMRKGQAIQVSGVVKSEGYIYIQVANGASIIPTAGSDMELDQMINIVATPQKKARIE